ncbi:ORF V: Enzymatic polyprotein [Labeo rohita]|uniref:ribonuclease H n=1 Tax=Labeo rohita TaxID=84645 RepID=A0ABQ8ME10_LABRO|nr:ORF V: Enzymatic polyprotein [Labeo rohita]
MPFRLCPSGCGFYLSPNDRHDRCVQCLERGHAEAAFADGGCQACEELSLSTLRSRLGFFTKKPQLTPAVSRSGPSTPGYEAAAGTGDEREESSDVLPGASPKTARSECLPTECPDDFENSSQYGLDLLFGAPAGEKEDAAASEGEREPSEVDVMAEFAAPAAGSQSMADAEMAAALQRAAREIGVAWAPPPGLEPSRLDDWFLGKGRDPRPRSSPVPFFPEVHEELTRSWKAPLSARSRYANSPSLTTLDGGPARGYTEVPQVERAIAMHLCPQNAASWRGQPKLPSRACKFSSTLVAKAYSASGQAASALHAMAILQVYQAKVLKDLHEGVPDPELVQELRSATDYALRATKVTAQALGRAMSTMVVQERHLWLNLAEMRDAEKVRFLDAPISQAGLFGETVEEFALQFSTVKKQTEAIKHILPRRVASSSPAPSRQQPPPRTPIETVPSAEMRKGFYSPYFIVPKKGGGLRPILDLRILNRTLHKRPFKMLTLKHLFTCVRAQDWFVAIDLKDAYFHVSILPRHRLFLRFAFEGRAYQYRVLPFGLSLSPLIFTKIAEAALTPLREMGIRVCNYLNDWLILAHSLELVCTQREVVLNHLAQLGLRVNWEKSKLSPVQRISFLGVELDSISMSARLSPERAQSVLRCAATLRCRSMVPLKQVQRLLGHMASAAAVTPLGLMHMRPLQHWLHTRVPRWAWRRGTLRVGITPSCRKTLSPWTDLAFLRSGVPLEQVSRRIVVTTDASKTGWGAVCNGQAASGVWMGPRLLWHINCLELLAVLLALKRFRPLVQGKHVLVRSDNTATVAYINHQGGVRSFRMSRLARHLWLWSQHRLRSLRATHIPGEANRVADSLSRQVSLGGEWRLHPQAVQLIWDRFGQAQVDLFASPESTHCQLWYGLSEAPLGIDALAHSWPKNRLKYAFPPNLVLRPGAPGISPSLAHSPEEGPPLSGEGHNLAPAPRSLEPPSMVPGRDQEDFRDLSPSVVNTLLQARAPSTRRLYDLKWRIFVNWCSSRGEDPRRCGVESVLSFLQGGLDRHLSASTLKISERSPETEPSPAASDPLLGSRCGCLQRDPFEPLQSVEVDALSLKTALLTALTSVKRVGDLQALSINNACLEFGPADSHVVLRPRPGYVPKVPTTPFRDQVVTLQAISSQEDDPNLTLLCPVRALRIYLERTQPFRCSEQLFVCYGGQQKGKAVSKQRISHWLVDAIRMAYKARGLPCPLGIRAHSTRGVAASAALANGASLTDICRAAVAPQAAPCVYFPPIAQYGAVFPLRSGCDLRSASFPWETVTSPTSAKTLSRSTETGPAAGHCCNRSVLGRWKVTKSVRQIGNVSVTYGNPRSLMEGTETLCLPCHNSGPSLSELRRSAPHIRTSEQMHTLPYLYPDERGVASYANLHTQFSLACFYTVRGVWAPKSDP